MAYFSESLSGETLEWYTHQDVSKWHAWGDMIQDFILHYQYNVDINPDRFSLSPMEKKPKESFREFWFRWNEQVARDSPLINRKDVAEPRQRQDPVGIPANCFQPQYRPHEYPRAPHNSPQYYPPNNVRSSVQPPGRSLWRAPAPHNAFLPSQRFRAPNDPRQQGQGGEQRQRNSFTPIGESYTSLFEMLKHSGQIEPLLGYTPDPYAKGFDPTVQCMYNSNVQGHIIEYCRSLKRKIERMIQEGVIVINDSDREHANPLGNLLTEVNDIEVGNGLGNTDVELNG